jgi:glycosyltransferase involved in cell wall biosynthesis
MKIAFYHSAPFPSLRADAVHIVEMCKNMTTLGHTVTLVCPRANDYTSDDVALFKTKEFYGYDLDFKIVFIKRVTVFGKLQTLGSLLSAKRVLKNADYDLIYTVEPWASLILPSLNVPFVFEAHDFIFNKSSDFLSLLQRKWVLRAARHSSCSLFVTISAALKEVWGNLGVPAEKLFVAHDAVDLDLFSNTLTKTDARQKLGMSTQKPVVVHAGALYETYGILQIFEAAALLPEMEFFLVGGNQEDLSRCQVQVSQLNLSNVHLMGPVPHTQVPVWLAAGDILLMMWSSRFPTMAICSPMKVFEYMSAERLIVGPAFPTITEVLHHDENAILFEPDSLEGLVSALKKAQNEYHHTSLPEHARTKVVAEHTWLERCRQILNAIKQPHCCKRLPNASPNNSALQ